jgi:tetratricopeptide (TPR) repeat protein
MMNSETSMSTEERAWWNTLRMGQDDERGEARLNLAVLLQRRGDLVAAEALLIDAIGERNPKLTPEAALRLGHLYAQLDRCGEAAAEYERAASESTPRKNPDVLLDVAARWTSLGDIDRASDAYRGVHEQAPADRRRFAAIAAYRLAHIHQERGAIIEAMRWWRLANNEADADLLPHVLVDLADVLCDVGDAADRLEAETLYVQAIEADHPDLSPRAAIALADMSREHGAFIQAFQLYEDVIESEHPRYRPEAEARREELVTQELERWLQEAHEPNVQPELWITSGGGKAPARIFLTGSAAAETALEKLCDADLKSAKHLHAAAMGYLIGSLSEQVVHLANTERRECLGSRCHEPLSNRFWGGGFMPRAEHLAACLSDEQAGDLDPTSWSQHRCDYRNASVTFSSNLMFPRDNDQLRPLNLKDYVSGFAEAVAVALTRRIEPIELVRCQSTGMLPRVIRRQEIDMELWLRNEALIWALARQRHQFFGETSVGGTFADLVVRQVSMRLPPVMSRLRAWLRLSRATTRDGLRADELLTQLVEIPERARRGDPHDLPHQPHHIVVGPTAGTERPSQKSTVGYPG